MRSTVFRNSRAPQPKPFSFLNPIDPMVLNIYIWEISLDSIGTIFCLIQDYMKEQHLSSVMQQRVLNFFDYLWVRNKGTDRQSLLNDLPYCMQAEVSLATTESLLKQVLCTWMDSNSVIASLMITITGL